MLSIFLIRDMHGLHQTSNVNHIYVRTSGRYVGFFGWELIPLVYFILFYFLFPCRIMLRYCTLDVQQGDEYG